ncbi:sodium/calcium exchanger membrane region [Caldalkalibacillus thermarum TA2.A1]|uniref:Sodium/calcium exchanger membrane region n=1 Tax=Caldalkalibacillus thermarum (strain TA2.A1) TaxID=986075 RepID=F5L8D0_CALTT|nr:sodium:calcium antiporter [Caldalkalibacillus thermarum]EGL82363.1 sodium/calcium exchanger membrane region [Caldalkalibacillus thermarum TA2.A1]QZT34241.1 sodium:calcium antiporter [Caldalkalibacillus thermarum TA2.A1]
MVYLLFVISALVTIVVAVRLSTYADVISHKTAFGGMIIGAVLLAVATSLPEVTTSVTSILINSPDLAVGNVLGSNLFNLLIIAVFDLYFRQQQGLLHTTRALKYTAVLALYLSMAVFLFLLAKFPYEIWGVGVDTLFLIAVYGTGMVLISRLNKEDGAEVSVPVTRQTMSIPVKAEAERGRQPNDPSRDIPVRQAWIGFIVASVIILVAGSVLTMTGDRIAELTGLGSTFVGSFLIAASTSLPESVSVYTAFQLRNYQLAIGSVLSSNLFNILILGLTDLLYRKGPLLYMADETHRLTAMSAIVLLGIVLYAMGRRQPRPLFYPLPSAMLVVLYFVYSYLIYVNSSQY